MEPGPQDETQLGLDELFQNREYITPPVRGLVQDALSTIHERFELTELPEFQHYHNTIHTLTVIDRSFRILDEVRKTDPTLVSDRDYGLIAVAAAYHDVVQNFSEKIERDEHGITSTVRARKLMINESDSAHEAINAIRKNGAHIFTPEELGVIYRAIVSTTPQFKGGTVQQVTLPHDSSLVIRTLCMADISGSGLDSPEKALFDADMNFLEDYISVARMIKSGVQLTPKEMEELHFLAIEWLENQDLFIRMREKNIDRELPRWVGKEDVTENLRQALFEDQDGSSRFSNSRRYIKETREQREAMTPEELVTELRRVEATVLRG